MYRNIRFQYSDIVNHSMEVIEYLIRGSNKLSLITRMQKPYSKVPPLLKHDSVLRGFDAFLLEQKIDIKKWPGTKTEENHVVMNIYRACEAIQDTLIGLPNIFVLNPNLPEDICFYRRDYPWLITITHEKVACMEYPTDADIAFFDSISVRYWLRTLP